MGDVDADLKQFEDLGRRLRALLGEQAFRQVVDDVGAVSRGEMSVAELEARLQALISGKPPSERARS